jgi:cobalt-zinc-cadmium efflux system outer membrane protein
MKSEPQLSLPLDSKSTGFVEPTAIHRLPLPSDSQFDPAEQIQGLEQACASDVEFDFVAVNGDGSGVTRAEIRNQALRFHPAVAEARAVYESLKGKYHQSGLPPNPTVGVIADDINEDGGAGRYGVFWGRKIVRGKKLEASQDIVGAELQSAAFRLQEIEQRLLTDVDRFFFDVLIAQEQLALARRLVDVSQRAVTVSQSLLQGLEVPKTSVLQAQLQLKKSEIAVRRFESAHLSARRKLAAIIGQEDLPTPQVAGNAREEIEIDDFESAYDRLLQNSPELSRLFADIETRKRELIRNQRESISDINWQTSLQYDFVTDDVIGGFQVGWKIPTLNRNQGAIYQSSQQVAAAERRAETKSFQLRRRLAEAYEQYLDAKLQVEGFEKDVLPIATETNRLLVKGFHAGETPVFELLVSQRLLFQTHLNYLQNLRILGQQTALITGLLLDDGLNQ